MTAPDDATLKAAIAAIVRARGTALSILDISESLHARGVIILTQEARLLPSHPIRQRVATLTLALCREGAFASLGIAPADIAAMIALGRAT